MSGRKVFQIAMAALALASYSVQGAKAFRGDYVELEMRLAELRKRWKVPGMAAGVAHGDEIVWAKGFGYAELTTKEPVTTETVFHLASLTKPFAAVVLLQLVEARQLDLDTPVRHFGVDLQAEGEICVRHLLTHTSEGKPGDRFRYSGNRFAKLDKVLEGITGKSFAQLLSERILEPLALTNTAPNPYNPAACVAAAREAPVFLRRSARGYAFDGRTPVDYPKHFVTAAGLVSTVSDVLRFSMALDGDKLLKSETRQMAFTPARTSSGKPLPYGMGWFVQQRRGAKILWHYGWDRANSTLLIKVPQDGVAFVLLGNSEALSKEFGLGRDEDVTRSPFARAFLHSIGH